MTKAILADYKQGLERIKMLCEKPDTRAIVVAPTGFVGVGAKMRETLSLSTTRWEGA
jgi:hypothetical protein